ncbi:AsmA family protein [Sphingomonas sp. 1P06PA]|uniref:AsmA family protein n=1 Tax=Sphingomonas sp. 1P06PA TaxID=554121 RepID=UPI0039A7227E
MIADVGSGAGAVAATSPRRDPADTAISSVVAVIATLVGLLVLAWAILYVTKGRFLKPTFERIASRNAEREIKVAGDFQFYFDFIDLKFLAEGLTVANPQWAERPLFFRADRIDARVASIPWLFGTRRVNMLDLTNGDVDLEWDRNGRSNTWTFGDPNAPGDPFELPTIRQARIVGSDVRYRDHVLQLLADLSIDTVRAADTRFSSDVRFTGTGTMRARPFRVTGSLLSPNATISGGRNRLVARATSGSDTLDVSGTLPGATELEGSRLKVAARGANLADLFAFLGVVTPDTRAYRLTSNLTKRGEEWRFTRLAGRFGDSDLGGSMTVSLPSNRLLIEADLASRVVDIIDVGPFVGYDARLLDAKGAAGAVRIVAGTPRVLPDASLEIDAISRFDAKVNYTVRRVRAETFPISNIAVTVDLDRSLLKLSPLTFDMAGGKLSSDIAINARSRPVVTDYDIRLAPTPMGTLLASWGTERSGTTGTLGARVQLKGEGDSVRESLASADGRIAIIIPRGTFWARNIQLSELDVGTFVQKMFEGELKDPVDINCGLIAFTVRDGIAAADPILIDTRKNVMLGRGGFSFKDESLDIGFRADSKKFSLFAGQSPVGIGGRFAAPSINVISPQLLSRAGAGVGLALVATPLAGVLAFVDVGNAKSAACGPVLRGATAVAQRTTKGKPRDDVGKGRATRD